MAFCWFWLESCSNQSKREKVNRMGFELWSFRERKEENNQSFQKTSGYSSKKETKLIKICNCKFHSSSIFSPFINKYSMPIIYTCRHGYIEIERERWGLDRMRERLRISLLFHCVYVYYSLLVKLKYKYKYKYNANSPLSTCICQ